MSNVRRYCMRLAFRIARVLIGGFMIFWGVVSFQHGLTFKESSFDAGLYKTIGIILWVLAALLIIQAVISIIIFKNDVDEYVEGFIEGFKEGASSNSSHGGEHHMGGYKKGRKSSSHSYSSSSSSATPEHPQRMVHRK